MTRHPLSQAYVHATLAHLRELWDLCDTFVLHSEHAFGLKLFPGLVSLDSTTSNGGIPSTSTNASIWPPMLIYSMRQSMQSIVRDHLSVLHEVCVVFVLQAL